MKVERLLNLMLHSRQKRELPFWTGETNVVLGLGIGAGWGAGIGWEATAEMALFGSGDDPTFSLRISGTGDKVREGALGGDTGCGEPAEGDPSPAEGLPFTSEETGEVAPLLVCPLMLSLCTRESNLDWLVGVVEVVAAPSLGLRLGLRLTALPWASWGG